MISLAQPALSVVIPLYNSEKTLRAVVAEVEALPVDGGLELILVNDGSRDGTAELCRNLLGAARVPTTYVEHARNYGEHNAVLTGWRHARGAHIVNLDDDGQNPPAEALKLHAAALQAGHDVVYGVYADKRHSSWRNWGSRLANATMDRLLDKPRGLYLSSFRCVSALVARSAAANTGPFPYIDGLLLQISQRIGSVEVRHADRMAGRSGYTLRSLGRLWLSTLVNFSVMPLRVAAVLGLLMAAAGFAGLAVVAVLWWRGTGPEFGWGSLMGALLVFSGVQLIMLGVIGEYLGRLFLTVNQRPQSVVRTVARSPDG